MKHFDAILAEALRLSPADRADLAAQLLASLDGPVEHGVEAAWATEIERRMREIDGGTVECIPWEEVRRRLRGRPDGAT